MVESSSWIEMFNIDSTNALSEEMTKGDWVDPAKNRPTAKPIFCGVYSVFFFKAAAPNKRPQTESHFQNDLNSTPLSVTLVSTW